MLERARETTLGKIGRRLPSIAIAGLLAWLAVAQGAPAILSRIEAEGPLVSAAVVGICIFAAFAAIFAGVALLRFGASLHSARRQSDLLGLELDDLAAAQRDAEAAAARARDMESR